MKKGLIFYLCGFGRRADNLLAQMPILHHLASAQEKHNLFAITDSMSPCRVPDPAFSDEHPGACHHFCGVGSVYKGIGSCPFG